MIIRDVRCVEILYDFEYFETCVFDVLLFISFLNGINLIVFKFRFLVNVLMFQIKTKVLKIKIANYAQKVF